MIQRPTALLPLCLMLSSILISGQARTPEQRDWEWLDAHYSKALEILMPVETNDRTDVVYRQHDTDGDIPEQYFTLNSVSTSEAIDAIVAAPKGSSIYRQLLDAHMADRDASFESLAARGETPGRERVLLGCGLEGNTFAADQMY